MKREFLRTGDGSITIHLPDWNEQYHSKHGAINEALHVFIETGFEYFFGNFQRKEVSILEIGFGTGLNAFLTAVQAEKTKRSVSYTGVEAYPVDISEVKELNYPTLVKAPQALFDQLHEVPWEETTTINEYFSLTKRKQFFADIEEVNCYDLIYFDAFGARVQPDLWTEDIFEIMYKSLKEEGVLVTYAAKGSVRRAMQAVGFLVERLPGPPGKREMLRAVKEI